MELIAEVLSSGDSGQRLTLQPGLEALSAGGFRSRVDSAVNTDPDWEEQIRTMLEFGCKLTEDFNAMKLKQQQDELDFNKSRGDLQKKRDQAIKQHQALLEKLESVRVKLQLNNSKATRKNFLSKIQEVTSEKSRAQDEKDRLCAELAEVDLRLSSLQQEQEVERTRWQQDLTELRSQTERAQKQAKDSEAKAVKDQRSALERHRHMADEMVTAWTNQVGVYLSGVRAELPHKYHQEKAQWERRQTSVKKSQTELHTKINDLLLRLDRPDLELPALSLPALPQVPMAELYFHRIMQMTPRPPPPVLAPPLALVNPRGPLLPSPRHAHFRPTRPLHAQFPRQQHTGAAPSPQLPPPSRHPHGQTPPPQTQTPPPRTQTPPATTSNPDVRSHSSAPPPAAMATPSVPPPAAVAPPSVPPPGAVAPPSAPPPAAVGKLDKVLERLGAQFPRCSRAQLTWLLQQVKSERGTLAGLSMEDVVEQIRHKMKTSSSGPRAATPAQAAPPAAPRKPCLVCQKPVDPGAKFNLNCSHTVHTDCIQVWLQSSKSHSCPFCPSR